MPSTFLCWIVYPHIEDQTHYTLNCLSSFDTAISLLSLKCFYPASRLSRPALSLYLFFCFFLLCFPVWHSASWWNVPCSPFFGDLPHRLVCPLPLPSHTTCSPDFICWLLYFVLSVNILCCALLFPRVCPIPSYLLQFLVVYLCIFIGHSPLWYIDQGSDCPCHWVFLLSLLYSVSF